MALLNQLALIVWVGIAGIALIVLIIGAMFLLMRLSDKFEES